MGKTFLSSPNWFNKQVIGGWQISGVQRLATGEPVQIFAVNNANGDYFTEDYANLACDPNAAFTPMRFHVFNGSCFVEPPTGTLGRGGRGIVRAPRLNTIDLSLAKIFHLTERQQLEFRFDAFSAFNHPNFLEGEGTVGNPGLGEVSHAVGQRVGQLSLQYIF